MNQYVTGAAIKKLREENNMTQQQLADKLSVSAKTVSSDRLQMVKLYPQGNAEARFKMNGVKRIYFYCNRSGLFYLDVVKGIDDRRSGYEDTEERRRLESAAKMLFG